MNPASRSRVQWAAISYTNVAMDDNPARCNKLHELLITFTHTVSNSWITNTMLTWLWSLLAVPMCREQLSATQTYPWIIIRLGVSISFGCASRSRILYPILGSLTWCSTGNESSQLLSCAVSSFQLHKRGNGLSCIRVQQALWDSIASTHIIFVSCNATDWHEVVSVLSSSMCFHVL